MSEQEPQKSESEIAAETLTPQNPLRDFAEAYKTAGDGDEPTPEAEKPAVKPDAESEAGEAEKGSGIKTLAGMAEKLGVEVSALYDVEIPRANGAEPFTLGQLKDAMADQETHEVKALEWEEQRRKESADISRAKQELEELAASLPAEALTSEKMAKVRQRREAGLTHERQRTLEVIPEWKQEETRETELRGIVEHMKDYGFADDYLLRVSDHRMLRYIRENWRRDQQITKSLARVSELKSVTPSKSAKQTDKPKRAAPRIQSRGEKQVSGFMDTINRAAGD